MCPYTSSCKCESLGEFNILAKYFQIRPSSLDCASGYFFFQAQAVSFYFFYPVKAPKIMVCNIIPMFRKLSPVVQRVDSFTCCPLDKLTIQ